jgi:hypothetical protein
MHFSLRARASSASIIALGLLLGAPANAQQQPRQAPATEQAPAAVQPAPSQPAAAEPAQSGAGSVALDEKEKDEQQSKAEKAVHSTSGKGGKQEPSVSDPQPPAAGPVLVNGRLNVPGAPADSQTVPAKFSERNARIDSLPIMAFPLGLTEEQRRRIAALVQAEKPHVHKLHSELSQELPLDVVLNDLPPELKAEVPAVSGLMYVRTPDRVLLIAPANRIVVGEVMVGDVKG